MTDKKIVDKVLTEMQLAATMASDERCVKLMRSGVVSLFVDEYRKLEAENKKLRGEWQKFDKDDKTTWPQEIGFCWVSGGTDRYIFMWQGSTPLPTWTNVLFWQSIATPAPPIEEDK